MSICHVSQTEQQKKVDTESTTHTGMEYHSMSSRKYLLLHVWCGLLTVAMLVMAALLISIKTKLTEYEVPTLRPEVSPTVNTTVAPSKVIESSLSHIQLMKSPDNRLWQDSQSCDSCFLIRQGSSIHCKKDSLYFIYAQVTFTKRHDKNQAKSVILIRNAAEGKSLKKLVEGTFPPTTEGSKWVSNIVSLRNGESISVNITGEFLIDVTFWGAYELH